MRSIHQESSRMFDVVAEYIRKENTRSLEDEMPSFPSWQMRPHIHMVTRRFCQCACHCLRMLAVCKVKEFIFYFIYIERATGEAITHAVIECLKDHNIDISKARGQNYDGTQRMSSDKVGVEARLKRLSPRASTMPVDYLPQGI